jgi:hypothetical protein
MHRKTENTELDIPKDDIECWERYPKHRWVYDMSRLLDAQSIMWAPYEAPDLTWATPNIVLQAPQLMCEPGIIYTKKPEGPPMWTEVYVAKGEIKLMRHIDHALGPAATLVGGIELRINAFVSLYFNKFTGVFTANTYGNDIYRIRLRPFSELALTTNTDIVKLTKRIYKKTDLSVSGLTDRSLHETLAS